MLGSGCYPWARLHTPTRTRGYVMALPIVAPAPVVTDPTASCRDLLDNQGQFRPCPHALTGLIVLPNNRMAQSARCRLDRADTTHLSRVLAEAPWREDAVHQRRRRCLRQQTKPPRRRRREALVVWEDTLGEHEGSLFDDVDRHDHPRDGTSPLAHHPVTRL
jgi:hypothetical protein